MYGFNMNSINGTMIPRTGRGMYVSVFSKGEIIQIKHEKGYEHLKYNEIRIIPCKDNHGVMIERFKDGKMVDRSLMDIVQFNKNAIFYSNIENIINQ